MPLRSGLDMSLCKNSSGDFPGRSSHSGTHPAPGASRWGGSTVVALNANDDEEEEVGFEKGVKAAAEEDRASVKRTDCAIFILSDMIYED